MNRRVYWCHLLNYMQVNLECSHTEAFDNVFLKLSSSTYLSAYLTPENES